MVTNATLAIHIECWYVIIIDDMYSYMYFIITCQPETCTGQSHVAADAARSSASLNRTCPAAGDDNQQTHICLLIVTSHSHLTHSYTTRTDKDTLHTPKQHSNLPRDTPHSTANMVRLRHPAPRCPTMRSRNNMAERERHICYMRRAHG